jgi:guanylate kinase
VGRATDRPEEIERRLAAASEELEAREEFAHVVVNDDLDRAAEELAALVRAVIGRDQAAARLEEGEKA